jgi:integrase
MERLKYLKRYTDRHGVERIYFNRRGTPQEALPGPFGSPAFRAAYDAALARSDGGAAPPEAPPQKRATDEGTLNDLIARYYRSLAFKTLAPITKKTYRCAIEQIRAAHGDKPVALLDRRGVKAQLAKLSDKPGAANNFLRHIRMLMAFAVEEGMRADNPAARIGRLKVPGDGFASWGEDEIAQFEAHHPIGSKARLAFGLLLFTAQRRGDVIRLGRGDVIGGRIRLRQSKTGAQLEIPIHPDLADILRTAPVGPATFLVTEAGAPFTSAGFGNWFRDRCDQAGVPFGYSAHGLRKAAARRLAEAGCSTLEIMSITGHKTLREVERYTRSVSQETMATGAMAKLTGRTF